MNIFEKLSLRRKSSSKKTTEFQVKDKKKISSGGYFAEEGVYSARLSMRVERKDRSTPVVIKSYGEYKDVTQLFERLSKVHQMMKRDGLSVARTLRFDTKKNITVMTDFNQADAVALAHRNPSEIVKEGTLESIPGFETLVKKLIAHTIHASEKGYYLPMDTYFLLIPQKEEGATDFVIGDLDIIRHKELGDKKNMMEGEGKDLLQENMRILRTFIGEFCMNWLKDKQMAQEYTAEAYDMVEAALAQTTQAKAA